MTTVVVPESVALRMFPICVPLCAARKAYGPGCPTWRHEPQCPARNPVTWLIQETAPVCETCRGLGGSVTHYWTVEHGQWVEEQECPTCNGTGRPLTVEIVSYDSLGWLIGERRTVVVGTVTLGEPVPVVVIPSPLNPSAALEVIETQDADPFIGIMQGSGTVVLITGKAAWTDITDAIRPQLIKPGDVAYPIVSVS